MAYIIIGADTRTIHRCLYNKAIDGTRSKLGRCEWRLSIFMAKIFKTNKKWGRALPNHKYGRVLLQQQWIFRVLTFADRTANPLLARTPKEVHDFPLEVAGDLSVLA
jgi:hypothetical protein